MDADDMMWGAGTLNAVTAAYLALRVVYAVLYVTTTTQKMSYLRSLVWGASTFMVMGLYVVAGRQWAARG
jgi:uncharacterized MAPEG superfamily protein